MKCFIASAFNRDDVDSIYDEVIKPLLDELSIRPLRVDRVEHNEDIDDKIYNLLNESDFCIADLTYARPSVYYEAGYAFGSGKPVIYITRSDHFKAKEDDVFGNFRVHFDLQMKNIIPWTEANKSFEERLRKRIKHIIKPIRAEKNQKARQRQNEEAFSKMSLMHQLAAIKKIVDGTYDALGYSEGGYPIKRPHGAKFFRLHMEKFDQNIYRQHHILIPKKEEGPNSYANLELVHYFCHQQLTAKAERMISVSRVVA